MWRTDKTSLKIISLPKALGRDTNMGGGGGVLIHVVVKHYAPGGNKVRKSYF